MANIKIKDLASSSGCNGESMLKSLRVYNEKSKFGELSHVVKEYLKNYDFSGFDLSEVDSRLEQALQTIDFKMSKAESDEEVKMLKNQLIRYFFFQENSGEKLIKRDYKGAISYGGKAFEVAVDFVFHGFDQDGPYYKYVNISRGKPTLKVKKSKTGNVVHESPTLFLMQLLGELDFPGKRVIPAFYHLRNQDDSGSHFVQEFNHGNIRSNVFDTNPASMDSNKILEKINAISTSDKPFAFKKCDTVNCTDCDFNLICNYKKPEQVKFELAKELPKTEKKKVEFTRSQKEAIDFDKGVLRINAGAGSGKTTLLVERVVRLIDEGTSPENILLITFTNKGAEEIRERVKKRIIEEGINESEIKTLKIFTFNSFGDLLIKKYHKLMGFESEPIIADKVDRYDVIFEVIEQTPKIVGLDYRNPLMSLPGAKGSVVLLDMLISKYISKQYANNVEFMDDVNVDENLNKFIRLTPENASKVINFYYLYQEIFIERNYIQYQDQINLMLELFKSSKSILDEWSIQHIMVDEYQDTDGVQLGIIKLLEGHMKCISLVIVGDDSQSIYSWRNVSSENIINFKKDFVDVKDLFLVDNFRSTPQIIYTANKLNQRNTIRIDKNLVSRKESGSLPLYLRVNTEIEEYTFITHEIEKKISNGRPVNEIAIIARTRKELVNIQEHLTAHNIPSIIHSPMKFVDHIHVQIISSLASFLYSGKNEMAFLEFLNVFHFEKLREMTEDEVVRFIIDEKVKLFLKFKNVYSDTDKKELFFEMIEPLIEEDLIMIEFMKTIKRRAGNFKSLMKYLRNFVLYSSEQSISLDTEKYNAVVLTTSHSSKGQEYPVVFATLNGFHLHKHFAHHRLNQLEEERRILFVVITRAKDELFITQNKKAIKPDDYIDEFFGVNKMISA